MKFMIEQIMGEMKDNKRKILMVVNKVIDIQREKEEMVIMGEDQKIENEKGVERVRMVKIKMKEIRKKEKEDIKEGMKSVLGKVRYEVREWKKMMKRIDGEIDD